MMKESQSTLYLEGHKSPKPFPQHMVATGPLSLKALLALLGLVVGLVAGTLVVKKMTLQGLKG